MTKKPRAVAETPASDAAKWLRDAEAHLADRAPQLAPVIAGIGPCTLRPDADVFRVMVRAMIAQLISVAAARSITARLEAKLKGKPTPARLLALTDDDLKTCGISGNKAKAVRELAEHFRANRKFAAAVTAADDLAARELLLPLRGVGPWTVDMVLMFGFLRPDILPVGDLGLRAGVKDLYKLSALPTPSELTELAEPWRPYRTIGTWYVWRSRGWSGTAT